MARIPDGADADREPGVAGAGLLLGNVHVMAGVPAVFEAMVAGLLPRLTGGRPLLSRDPAGRAPRGQIAGPLRVDRRGASRGLDRQLSVHRRTASSAPTSSRAARTRRRSRRRMAAIAGARAAALDAHAALRARRFRTDREALLAGCHRVGAAAIVSPVPGAERRTDRTARPRSRQHRRSSSARRWCCSASSRA